jgi:hypothetical protein
VHGTIATTDAWTDDATLDATVPSWRFTATGRGHPSALRGLVHGTASLRGDAAPAHHGGVVVEYLLTWEDAGVPYAAHHVHLLTLAPDGRIADDHVFCGGAGTRRCWPRWRRPMPETTTRPAGWALTPRPAAGVDRRAGGRGHPPPAVPRRRRQVGLGFERVEIDGRPYVLKTLHVDDDWIARSLGDWAAGPRRCGPPACSTRCRPLSTTRWWARPPGWAATAGARRCCMHDVGDRLIPEGDTG